MSLILSKTLDPADFAELAEELVVVDEYFYRAAPQHSMRRWEYAMALRAERTWGRMADIGGPVYDVGGAGSPFYRMLDPYLVRVVDPKEGEGQDLAGYLRSGPRLGAAVFCLSVLEHVKDLGQFVYHLGCLVAPGGLLFLTFDYSAEPAAYVQDSYHFHWMRERIFTAYSIGNFVTGPLHDVGFSHLGAADWTDHGAHVYDYSFASLALVKRP